MASFSHFFIDRPIFAAVVSIVITLTGAIALWGLPIAQYPPITPPSIQVSIVYPGASAQVVADTVAAPIEQQVNGVEGMLYMSSQMGNDGSYTLTVTFDVETNLNTALVMVQNRVSLAMPVLPTSVQNQGITIRKRTPDILMIVNFISPNDRYDDLYLSNYAMINVRDELLRVAGVSDAIIFGERDYSMLRLARSAEDGVLRPERRRRGGRDRPPESRSAGGADRPAAGHRRPTVRRAPGHAGPAGRAGAVRRHHRQGRPGHPPQPATAAVAPRRFIRVCPPRARQSDERQLLCRPAAERADVAVHSGGQHDYAADGHDAPPAARRPTGPPGAHRPAAGQRPAAADSAAAAHRPAAGRTPAAHRRRRGNDRRRGSGASAPP